MTANFTRGKKLAPLLPMLQDLDTKPSKAMTPKQLRTTIIGMAHAMGATVVHKKRGDP